MMNIPNLNQHTPGINTQMTPTARQPVQQETQQNAPAAAQQQTAQAPVQPNTSTPEAGRLMANLRQLQVQREITPVQDTTAPTVETEAAPATQPETPAQPAAATQAAPEPTTPAAAGEPAAPANGYTPPAGEDQNPLLDLMG